jgi:hypothetical protein
MSGDFALIARGFDLQSEHIAEAIGARERSRALLARLAQVSAPDTGIAKVLLVYARMATTACDWLDGGLWIDLTTDADFTVVDAYTELGGGLRERLFAPVRFKAPLSEFVRAIERVPHMIAPLTTRSSTARRLTLSASEVVRRTTAPPPPIEISAESLYVRIPSAGLPKERALSEPPLPVVGTDTPAEGNTAPDGVSNDVDGGWDE